MAPAKTPPEIVHMLDQHIAKVMQVPDIVSKLHADGTGPSNLPPAEFAKFMAKEDGALCQGDQGCERASRLKLSLTPLGYTCSALR